MPDPAPPTAFGNASDAYSPKQIAERVRAVGVTKARAPAFQLLLLALLAGAFISLGAAFFTVVVTDSAFGYGPTRLLGSLAFCLGLVLVVVAGAELFTGNTLIVMAWASGEVSTSALLRNWALVWTGNFAGAFATALAVHFSGVLAASGGSVGKTAVGIATAKVALPFVEAFLRGVLCNALVCLAVWLTFGSRSVSDKILAIVFPVSAFVACGFEHSVANMYLIPVGLLAGGSGAEAIAAALATNLLPVTLGNIVGGGVLVALVYWAAYLRPSE